MAPLAARLQYVFRDDSLLSLAVTHRSWCAENGGVPSNERLEFLGDAILGAVITSHLYEAYPDLSEGRLSKLRAAVVSAPALAETARELNLGDYILLSRGEDAMGGRDKTSILSDALEAVIGAVYLDGGWPAAKKVLATIFDKHIGDIAHGPNADPDYKGRLQELVARHFAHPPSYTVSESGPDHAKQFAAVVGVDGAVAGEGLGGSKKKAEQAAAKQAWVHLVDELEGGSALVDTPATETETQDGNADA